MMRVLQYNGVSQHLDLVSPGESKSRACMLLLMENSETETKMPIKIQNNRDFKCSYRI